MSSPVRAIIDIAALRHNLHLAKEHPPGSQVMAVIKADPTHDTQR